VRDRNVLSLPETRLGGGLRYRADRRRSGAWMPAVAMSQPTAADAPNGRLPAVDRVASQDGGPGRVTRIYLDPTALVMSTGGTEGAEHVAPGAADAVANLVEAGFEVVLLGDAVHSSLAHLPVEVGHADALPPHLDQDAWYLTGEPHPEFGRPRGGTTVLVGPKRPAGKLPPPRFDMETRDIASAAMEILTRQAMA
jgi:hypothetical protein